nr:ComGF family competence protein [Lactobacillus sp. Sy-1]
MMVAAIVISLCGLVIKMALAQRQSENNLTAFHLYLRMVESKEYQFQFVDIDDDHLVLKANGKRYLISLAKNSIKMTTNHGGYVPLMDGVQNVKWRYHKEILTTTIEMQNGAVFSAQSRLKTG